MATQVSYEARANFVIIRRVRVTRLIGSMAMPEGHATQIDYFVESKGENVRELEVGDQVMILGEPGKEFFDIPGDPDRLGIISELIPYRIRKVEVPAPVPEPAEAT